MEQEPKTATSATLEALVASLGYEWDALDNRTKEQLSKVNEGMNRIAERRRKLQEKLQTLNGSYASIAEESGLSRATLYNKNVVKELIEKQRFALGLSHDRTYEEQLRKELEDAKQTIAALVKRDAELVALKEENERLKKLALKSI